MNPFLRDVLFSLGNEKIRARLSRRVRDTLAEAIV